MPTTATDMISYTIYDRPRDYPQDVVVRKFVNGRPTIHYSLFTSVVAARRWLAAMPGNFCFPFCFPRDESDEPQIVETWL